MRTIAALLLALAVAALTLGCQGDATATPAPTPSPAAQGTATEAPSTATPTPTVAPPAAPAPTRAVPPEATAAPTPPDTPDTRGEADASDAYFALDRVLDISIEIAAEDWDTLRHQTRTFEDLMAEIEEYGLSRPFADIYDWFSGTVTVDGETLEDVGVRKKGFIGSQSDTKPSLKLRFDKYVDGQALGGAPPSYYPRVSSYPRERMTLNNSIQDPSMVNTCLSYRVFAAAGNPSPRCNFATVSVNGKELGLYVHVEEIKPPFLARHFESAEGNLYEGTVSDFTSDYRGTLEKKTNEDEADWSDVDAVVAALQDPSDAGLDALSEVVDLDRFLSFWATEVLVGHWDGYAGNRNNYHFYREPDGPFVFIPWGVDDTFHSKDDPNPFDNISDPPPSVLALTAITNRLYNHPGWRTRYARRLKEVLDSIWDEAKLLAAVDQMATIVQQHALPEARQAAAKDTERVRKFILKRRGEILADLTPEPPDWPEPDYGAATEGPQLGSLEVAFTTTWGSNRSANPLEEGAVISLLLDESEEPVDGLGAIAGLSSAEEKLLLPAVDETASIIVLGVDDDGSINGMTLVLALEQLEAGATLVIGEGAIAGGIWSIPPGAAEPSFFSPFTGGTLSLTEAGTDPGAGLTGGFAGVFGDDDLPGGGGADEAVSPGETGPAAFEVRFETRWGTNDSNNPLAEGTTYELSEHGKWVAAPKGEAGATAGPASPQEAADIGVEDAALITVMGLYPDSTIQGFTIWLPLDRISGGAKLTIGEDPRVGGVVWHIPPGGTEPQGFLPVTGGGIELTNAGTEPGAAVAGRLYASFGSAAEPAESGDQAVDVGLVINEVAAKGDPLDWFELHNTLPDPIALFAMLVADDLTDAGKRVAFPPGTEIQPGEYLRFELDKDGWPGFALGGDEELGIWLLDGTLVAMVDWNEGDSGEGDSYARVPDATGDFQTVGSPTPGAANQS